MYSEECKDWIHGIQGNQRWTLDTGQWNVDTGHWTMDTGRWNVDIGQEWNGIRRNGRFEKEDA